MARRSRRGASRKQARKPMPTIHIPWHKMMPHAAGIVSVLVVLAIASYIYQNSALPILHVTVEGDFIHVDKDALVKAVSPFATGSFLSVNVANLRKAGEELPWVKQVQVRRVWPDSLNLIVEEQIAVARWKEKWLVNTKGETFLSPASEIPSGLAILQGPENSQEVVVQRYQYMAIELANYGLFIKQLEMDERRAWQMTLNNGLKVVLGRANSEHRFSRFIRVYQSKLQQYKSQIAVLDMRYTNGLAVVWKLGQKPNFNGTV